MTRLESLGEFLKEQRRSAQLSLRQLADQSGVSNPYLSQIERGLRKPSAEVLQQLAKGLRISAETLYTHAGILEPDDPHDRSVEVAVLVDPVLTERQKRILLDIYTSFRHESQHANTTADERPESAHDDDAKSTAESTTAYDTAGGSAPATTEGKR